MEQVEAVCRGLAPGEMPDIPDFLRRCTCCNRSGVTALRCECMAQSAKATAHS
jgi:hypothetical protein